MEGQSSSNIAYNNSPLLCYISTTAISPAVVFCCPLWVLLRYET